MNKQRAMAGALALAAGLVSAGPAQAADSATTTIMGKITAVCEVSMPSVITIPDIPYTAAMDDKGNVGKLIPNARTEFKISGSCSGSAKFRYTFTAEGDDEGCIVSSPRGAVSLCIWNVGSGSKFNFASGNSPTIENLTNGDTLFSIDPAYGTDPKVTAYSATLSVKIEPM